MAWPSRTAGAKNRALPGSADARRGCQAGAVLRDPPRRIVRTQAAVEAVIEAIRNAAAAGEEAVADARKRGKRGSLEHDTRLRHRISAVKSRHDAELRIGDRNGLEQLAHGAAPGAAQARERGIPIAGLPLPPPRSPPRPPPLPPPPPHTISLP